MALQFKNSPYKTKDYIENGKVYLRVVYRNLKHSIKGSFAGKERRVKRVIYVIRRHD